MPSDEIILPVTVKFQGGKNPLQKLIDQIKELKKLASTPIELKIGVYYQENSENLQKIIDQVNEIKQVAIKPIKLSVTIGSGEEKDPFQKLLRKIEQLTKKTIEIPVIYRIKDIEHKIKKISVEAEITNISEITKKLQVQLKLAFPQVAYTEPIKDPFELKLRIEQLVYETMGKDDGRNFTNEKIVDKIISEGTEQPLSISELSKVLIRLEDLSDGEREEKLPDFINEQYSENENKESPENKNLMGLFQSLTTMGLILSLIPGVLASILGNKSTDVANYFGNKIKGYIKSFRGSNSKESAKANKTANSPENELQKSYGLLNDHMKNLIKNINQLNDLLDKSKSIKHTSKSGTNTTSSQKTKSSSSLDSVIGALNDTIKKMPKAVTNGVKPSVERIEKAVNSIPDQFKEFKEYSKTGKSTLETLSTDLKKLIKTCNSTLDSISSLIKKMPKELSKALKSDFASGKKGKEKSPLSRLLDAIKQLNISIKKLIPKKENNPYTKIISLLQSIEKGIGISKGNKRVATKHKAGNSLEQSLKAIKNAVKHSENAIVKVMEKCCTTKKVNTKNNSSTKIINMLQKLLTAVKGLGTKFTSSTRQRHNNRTNARGSANSRIYGILEKINRSVGNGTTAIVRAILRKSSSPGGFTGGGSSSGSTKKRGFFASKGAKVGGAMAGISAITMLLSDISSLGSLFGSSEDGKSGQTSAIMDSILNTVMMIGSIFATIGPMISSAIGFIMPVLTTIGTTIMGAITAIGWPIIAIVAAVVAVGALIYAYWDEIVAGFQWLWEKLKMIGSMLWDGIKWYFEMYWKVIKFIANGFWNMMMSVWEFIKSIPKIIMNFPMYLKKAFSELLSFITGIIDVIMNPGEAIGNAWDSVKGWFSSDDDEEKKASPSKKALDTASSKIANDLKTTSIDTLAPVQNPVEQPSVFSGSLPNTGKDRSLNTSSVFRSKTTQEQGSTTNKFESLIQNLTIKVDKTSEQNYKKIAEQVARVLEEELAIYA